MGLFKRQTNSTPRSPELLCLWRTSGDLVNSHGSFATNIGIVYKSARIQQPNTETEVDKQSNQNVVPGDTTRHQQSPSERNSDNSAANVNSRTISSGYLPSPNRSSSGSPNLNLPYPQSSLLDFIPPHPTGLHTPVDNGSHESLQSPGAIIDGYLNSSSYSLERFETCLPNFSEQSNTLPSDSHHPLPVGVYEQAQSSAGTETVARNKRNQELSDEFRKSKTASKASGASKSGTKATSSSQNRTLQEKHRSRRPDKTGEPSSSHKSKSHGQVNEARKSSKSKTASKPLLTSSERTSNPIAKSDSNASKTQSKVSASKEEYSSSKSNSKSKSSSRISSSKDASKTSSKSKTPSSSPTHSRTPEMNQTHRFSDVESPRFIYEIPPLLIPHLNSRVSAQFANTTLERTHSKHYHHHNRGSKTSKLLEEPPLDKARTDDSRKVKHSRKSESENRAKEGTSKSHSSARKLAKSRDRPSQQNSKETTPTMLNPPVFKNVDFSPSHTTNVVENDGVPPNFVDPEELQILDSCLIAKNMRMADAGTQPLKTESSISVLGSLRHIISGPIEIQLSTQPYLVPLGLQNEPVEGSSSQAADEAARKKKKKHLKSKPHRSASSSSLNEINKARRNKRLSAINGTSSTASKSLRRMNSINGANATVSRRRSISSNASPRVRKQSSSSRRRSSASSEISARRLEKMERRRRRRERELRRERRRQEQEAQEQMANQQIDWVSIPRDPPSYDEFEVPDSSLDTPPYREKLHKHFDLISFDPRYTIPVLRINKSLIKSSTTLEKTMWKLKGFNILPDEVNLWKIRQIDDRNLNHILPELLTGESGSQEEQQLQHAMYLSLVDNSSLSRSIPSTCAQEQSQHPYRLFNSTPTT